VRIPVVLAAGAEKTYLDAELLEFLFGPSQFLVDIACGHERTIGVVPLLQRSPPRLRSRAKGFLYHISRRFKTGALMAPGMCPRLNSIGLRGSMTTGALFDCIRRSSSLACMQLSKSTPRTARQPATRSFRPGGSSSWPGPRQTEPPPRPQRSGAREECGLSAPRASLRSSPPSPCSC
jgi:hypothetical protein